MTNEGVTMDQNGILYVVDEDGGGSQRTRSSGSTNRRPNADTGADRGDARHQIDLAAGISTTGARVKVADVTVDRPRRLRRKRPHRDRPRRELTSKSTTTAST